jgi:hypothetical protein
MRAGSGMALADGCSAGEMTGAFIFLASELVCEVPSNGLEESESLSVSPTPWNNDEKAFERLGSVWAEDRATGVIGSGLNKGGAILGAKNEEPRCVTAVATRRGMRGKGEPAELE